MPILYALTDEHLLPRAEFLARIEEALAAGVGMIQFRDKYSTPDERIDLAKKVNTLCERYDVPMIVNDDIGLAQESGARGVHLGRGDASIEEAWELLARDAIVGVSCYDSLDRAREAVQRGASYIAFGSVFVSPTKPDAPRVAIETLREAKGVFSVDICAIGGITPENASEIAGLVDIIAVNSSVWNSRSISVTVKNFLDQFENIKA